MNQQKRFLVFGAHPDDADLTFGGTAVKLVKAGHIVKFVSMTNGNCGHFVLSGQELAERRYAETQASRAVSGISEYQVVMENDDGELEPTVENRKKVIRIIRTFKPDVVLAPRTCDYHADHRAAAQLVQDAAYLTQVPKYCPDSPIPEEYPVFGCLWDPFQEPRPFRPDAAVAIDDVMETKCRMFDCHVSQVYEWLAWEKKIHLDPASMTWEEKKKHLCSNWCDRYLRAAEEARQTLRDIYGEDAEKIRYAETFERSAYGRDITVQQFRELMLP